KEAPLGPGLRILLTLQELRLTADPGALQVPGFDLGLDDLHIEPGTGRPGRKRLRRWHRLAPWLDDHRVLAALGLPGAIDVPVIAVGPGQVGHFPVVPGKRLRTRDLADEPHGCLQLATERPLRRRDPIRLVAKPRSRHSARHRLRAPHHLLDAHHATCAMTDAARWLLNRLDTELSGLMMGNDPACLQQRRARLSTIRPDCPNPLASPK